MQLVAKSYHKRNSLINHFHTLGLIFFFLINRKLTHLRSTNTSELYDCSEKCVVIHCVFFVSCVDALIH